MVIEVAVYSRCDDWHVRMRRFHAFDAFRGSQKAEEADILGTRLFQKRNRRRRRISRRQHRIDHDRDAFL